MLKTWKKITKAVEKKQEKDLKSLYDNIAKVPLVRVSRASKGASSLTKDKTNVTLDKINTK